MSEPTAQLRAIRLTLHARDLQLCRLGSHQEWVALGLPLTPTLRYRKGRWKCSHESLRSIVQQALGAKP